MENVEDRVDPVTQVLIDNGNHDQDWKCTIQSVEYRITKDFRTVMVLKDNFKFKNVPLFRQSLFIDFSITRASFEANLTSILMKTNKPEIIES